MEAKILLKKLETLCAGDPLELGLNDGETGTFRALVSRDCKIIFLSKSIPQTEPVAGVKFKAESLPIKVDSTYVGDEGCYKIEGFVTENAFYECTSEDGTAAMIPLIEQNVESLAGRKEWRDLVDTMAKLKFQPKSHDDGIRAECATRQAIN